MEHQKHQRISKSAAILQCVADELRELSYDVSGPDPELREAAGMLERIAADLIVADNSGGAFSRARELILAATTAREQARRSRQAA